MISNNTISFNAVGIMYGASEKNICMKNTIESNGMGISDNLSPYISGDKVQLRSQKIGSKIMGMGSQSGGHQDYLSGTMSLRIMIKVYGFYCVGCHQKQILNITISIPINAVSI
jgi:parallel beta-helix repeat protein